MIRELLRRDPAWKYEVGVDLLALGLVAIAASQAEHAAPGSLERILAAIGVASGFSVLLPSVLAWSVRTGLAAGMRRRSGPAHLPPTRAQQASSHFEDPYEELDIALSVRLEYGSSPPSLRDVTASLSAITVIGDILGAPLAVRDVRKGSVELILTSAGLSVAGVLQILRIVRDWSAQRSIGLANARHQWALANAQDIENDRLRHQNAMRKRAADIMFDRYGSHLNPDDMGRLIAAMSVLSGPTARAEIASVEPLVREADGTNDGANAPEGP